MISEKLTEKFIENHYFVLDESYLIEKYDENGFPTDNYINLEAGSEWEITDEDYIGGEIHLNGLTHELWIEISEETFRKCFSAHKWLMRNEKSCS